MDEEKALVRRQLIRLRNATWLARQRDCYDLAKCIKTKRSREIVVAFGILPTLVSMIAEDMEGRPAAASNAAYCLGRVGTDLKEGQDAIREAGALPFVVALLKSKHEHPRYRAASALARLCRSNPENAEMCRMAGVVPPLLKMIEDSPWKVQARAAQCAGAIAEVCPDARMEFLEGGIMTPMKLQLHKSPIRWVQSIAKDVLTDFGIDWDGSEAELSDAEDSEEESKGEPTEVVEAWKDDVSEESSIASDDPFGRTKAGPAAGEAGGAWTGFADDLSDASSTDGFFKERNPYGYEEDF